MAQPSMNFTQLLDTFQLIDTNKDGSISIDEFQSACEKLHMPMDKNSLRNSFQHRHSISFDEFCRVMQDFSPPSDDAYLRETFRAFDKNADGFITAKEIKRTMKELGEPLTDKQAKDMLKAADSNGDGKLSLEEFRVLFNYLNQFSQSPPVSPTSSISTNEHRRAQSFGLF